MRYLFGFMCVLALGVMGCGESGEAPPDDSPYANKDLWLCRPDIDNDHCDTAEVDCFYVYPSINFSPEPGNTEVLFPHSEESIVIVSVQAAPYRGACRLFAPLYHQMSEFTYLAFYNQVETTATSSRHSSTTCAITTRAEVSSSSGTRKARSVILGIKPDVIH